MRISDWSSDVCSSDLLRVAQRHRQHVVEVVVVPVHLRERQRRTRGILPAAVPRVENELDRLRRAIATLEVRSLIEVHRAVAPQQRLTERQSVVTDKSVAVSVDIGGSRINKKKKIN